MRNLICALSIFYSSLAIAQTNAALTEDVDSILDDLDKRLRDQENQVLTFGEQRLFEQDGEMQKKPSKTLRFQTKSITASQDVDNELKRLSDAVLALDNSIEDLDSNVQSAKQSILEAAQIDNIVNIAGKLSEDHATSLRSLVVKLDGYVIYELSESNGLWLPATEIPFYNGPLPPGQHSLEINGRLIHKAEVGMPINSNRHSAIKLTKTIDVKAGTSRQQIAIDLRPEKS